MMYFPLITGLAIFVVFCCEEGSSRPVTGNHRAPMRHAMRPRRNSHKRQEVVAIPPVATSILEGPYLPPADAENQLFIGPHGVPNPMHYGHPFVSAGHLLHPGPGFPGFHGYHFHPAPSFGHPEYHRYHFPSGYRRVIPYGLRHGYHTHWPHMQVSGPVYLSDPNDGMYQEPATGTLIPRPVIPPQYPQFIPPM